MSSNGFRNNLAIVFIVYSDGRIYDDDYVAFSIGVRPVINLSADITIKSGNGTSTSPYEI